MRTFFFLAFMACSTSCSKGGKRKCLGFVAATIFLSPAESLKTVRSEYLPVLPKVRRRSTSPPAFLTSNFLNLISCATRPWQNVNEMKVGSSFSPRKFGFLELPRAVLTNLNENETGRPTPCRKTSSLKFPRSTIGPVVFNAIPRSLEAHVCFSRSRGRNRLVFPLLFAPIKTVIGFTFTQSLSSKLRKLAQRNETTGGVCLEPAFAFVAKTLTPSGCQIICFGRGA